jgi:hypothetical protein
MKDHSMKTYWGVEINSTKFVHDMDKLCNDRTVVTVLSLHNR